MRLPDRMWQVLSSCHGGQDQAIPIQRIEGDASWLVYKEQLERGSNSRHEDGCT
jgi:hypothetical protein